MTLPLPPKGLRSGDRFTIFLPVTVEPFQFSPRAIEVDY